VVFLSINILGIKIDLGIGKFFEGWFKERKEKRLEERRQEYAHIYRLNCELIEQSEYMGLKEVADAFRKEKEHLIESAKIEGIKID